MNNKIWPWVVAIIAIIGIFSVTAAIIYLFKGFQHMRILLNRLGVL